MMETLNGLSHAGLMRDAYEVPEVTVVTISTEGLLCQSGGVLGAEHGGFAEDNGNPEDLW